MSESKQYVTQIQESGSVLISEDVIATIVANAVKDVDGIAGLSARPGSDIAGMIGKKNWGKGIKVVIDQNDEVYIDCNVNITYGQSVVAVAKAAQNAVTSALESAAGLKVASVNVNVCGVVHQ